MTGFLAGLAEAGQRNVEATFDFLGGAVDEVGETVRAGIDELGETTRAGIDEAGDVGQTGIIATAIAALGTATAYAGVLAVPGIIGAVGLAVDWTVFGGKGTKAAAKLVGL